MGKKAKVKSSKAGPVGPSPKKAKMAPKPSKSPKESKSAKKNDLQEKNLDDFLQDWSDAGDEESGSEQNDEDIDQEIENGPSGASKQKKYLASLKDKDPEFHAFLQENDKDLLDFDESSDEEDNDENGQPLDPVHTLPDSLDVASDDSDYEEEEDDKFQGKAKKVTKSMIDNWTEKLENQPNIQVISEVVLAFKGALANISSIQEQDKKVETDKKGQKKAQNATKYKVENGVTFNALIRLLITKLEPALAKLIKAKKVQDLQKSKNWKPLNKWLKSYLTDLSKFLNSISEATVLAPVLKHINNLVLYYAALPKNAKSVLKSLITLWSTQAEESIRVLAFMAIIRLVRTSMSSEENSLLELVMKQMYMAYIRNAKFTSPNTWPMIHFMRRSLAEIFLLDANLAYKHAFIYIRQLTIHLRNAMMNNSNANKSDSKKKKENPLQTVSIFQSCEKIVKSKVPKKLGKYGFCLHFSNKVLFHNFFWRKIVLRMANVIMWEFL